MLSSTCARLGCITQNGYCLQGPYANVNWLTCSPSTGWLLNETPFGLACQDLKCDPSACPSKCGQRPTEICSCIGNTSYYGSEYGTYICGYEPQSLCIKNACIDNSNSSGLIGATCTGESFITPYFTTLFNTSYQPVTSGSSQSVAVSIFSYEGIALVSLFIGSVGVFHFTKDETIPIIILIIGNFLLALFNIFNPAMEGFLIAIVGLEILFYLLEQPKGQVIK